MFGERILQRTPDYIESSKPQPDINADAFKPLSEIYFDLQRRTESTQTPGESLRTAKSKPKTRGVALAPTEPVDNAQREAIEREPAPIFEVDQKSLKVFKTLFYTPSLSGTPGDVSWTDFLHALNYVGLAPEKLYGSVWQYVNAKNKRISCCERMLTRTCSDSARRPTWPSSGRYNSISLIRTPRFHIVWHVDMVDVSIELMGGIPQTLLCSARPMHDSLTYAN